MTRQVKGTAALLALCVLVLGTPWLLLRVGQLGALRGLDWSNLLVLPDTGGVLLAAMTLAGWMAWAVFTSSVVAELVAVLTRERLRVRIPGTSALQPLVAMLVLAAVSMLGLGTAAASPAPTPAPAGEGAQQASGSPTGAEVSSPGSKPSPETQAPNGAQPTVTGGHGRSHVPAASESPGGRPTGAAAGTSATASTAGTRAAPESRPAEREHEVVSGDDLWTIAERHYGDGTQWRRIARANGLDPAAVLAVGMRLVLPGLVAPPAPAPEGMATPEEESSPHVTVGAGDTLSGLASRHLGEASRWPELRAANRDLVVDPDRIEAGWRLRLPTVTAEEERAAEHRESTSNPPADADAASQATAAAEPDQAAAAPPPETGAQKSGHVLPEAPATTVRPQPTGHTEATTAPDEGLPEAELTSAPTDLLTHAVRAGLGVLLAAGLAGALAARRRGQLLQRGLGRRLPEPSKENQRFEAALAMVADEAPEPAAAPPAAILLGVDEQGQPVLHDLEAAVTTTVGGDPEVADGLLAATVTGLALHPWSADSRVTIVGDLPWMASLEEPGVVVMPGHDQALEALERVAVRRRVALGRARMSDGGRSRTVPELRQDPELGEAWAPEVFVLASAPETAVWERVKHILDGAPLGISMLIRCDDQAMAGDHIDVRDADRAHRRSDGCDFRPHHVDPEARRALVELFKTTGQATTPAPWWCHDDDLPPNLALIEPRRPAPNHDEEISVETSGSLHPTLLLLGPVELHGCRGAEPSRARRQCIEYCAWIHQNPGRTSTTMSRELMVAEGTRRSNMSRLRNWLGSDPDGQPYLPDAYSGRIQLHPGVDTDWEHLQLLIASGVNRTSTEALTEALELVRGAPLADTAPGQWHWAEALRTDMVSVIRDVGVVLTERALQLHNLDLARWAAARALAAAPHDELLMQARIRTEHQAGNRLEVERLVLQLTRHARGLGVDLRDETVTLMQEVMEGRRRVRHA
ncbi:LysM peptidoglycan-binding domain-containing protein [Luteococcus sp. OSA5]|uniref:LysM peptidoglycan-binding domain-containing protein n=1 Tax=Luteococcus sp. OSA5 TaxID=3401630 RepID=UPI003B434742